MDKLKIHFYLNSLTRKEWIWNFRWVGLVFTLLEVSTKDIGCYCY